MRSQGSKNATASMASSGRRHAFGFGGRPKIALKSTRRKIIAIPTHKRRTLYGMSILVEIPNDLVLVAGLVRSQKHEVRDVDEAKN